jgi:hypothetical protein
MKLYLAGPMRGIKDFNFPEFHNAAEVLRRYGHEVFSPAEKDIEKHGDVFKGDGDQAALEAKTPFSLRDALGMDLAWICKEADGIALLKGWENSKGATAEHATALALGLVVVVQSEFGGWVQRKTRAKGTKPAASAAGAEQKSTSHSTEPHAG